MFRGLVFGKFMPLHRGHQLVIETALAECDDVTVVIYDSAPDGVYPAMPIDTRCGWIEALYPQVKTIVSLPDPVEGDGSDPSYAPVYAEQMAFLGKFARVYTSEPGYEAFVHQLGAKHRIVDAARLLVPISGTEIRKDPYANRGMMDPLVYSALVQKVVFVGTESTGKSTMAEHMAKRHDTLWAHEYGRELWEAQGLQGSFSDMLKIGDQQFLRERTAQAQARNYLFCDTNPWTTLQWSLMVYGFADSRLELLVNSILDEYLWVLCENDFGWIQDGTRELDGAKAQEFHDQQINDLVNRGISFHRIHGSVEDRSRQVDEILVGAQ